MMFIVVSQSAVNKHIKNLFDRLNLMTLSVAVPTGGGTLDIRDISAICLFFRWLGDS